MKWASISKKSTDVWLASEQVDCLEWTMETILSCLMLELMQQDLEILWPRPGCSIHEPWPPFAPCRSCPTAHCAFGGSPWAVTGADGEAATCNDCFLLKPLFETAFRHDLQRSTRTFKARVQNVQSSNYPKWEVRTWSEANENVAHPRIIWFTTNGHI